MSASRITTASQAGAIPVPAVALSGLLALTLAMGVGRFGYTALLPQMRDEGWVDLAGGGVLAAVNYLGYLAGALWAAFSRAADGRRRLTWGLLASVVSTFAMGLDLGLGAWCGVRFVAGWASAAVYVYATGLVLRSLAERNAAGWTALHYMGVGTGIALSAVVALEVAEWGTARQGWWGLGALAGFAALGAGAGLLRGGAPSAPVLAPAEGSTGTAPPLAWLAAAYGLAGFGYIVNATFLPVILRGQAGSAAEALQGWLLVGLAALPATALWVRLSFRWGVYPALMAATLVQAVGVALPVLAAGQSAALVGAVLLGGTFMGIAGLAQWLARVPDPSATARRIGLITACYGVGQIAGPLVVAGWGRDGDLRQPVLAASAALLLSVVLLEISRRRERLA